MSEQQPVPAEGPDDAAYTGENEQTSGGEVSEVQRLDQGDAGTPISPADSTAGYPPSESGDPDTQGSGPDAKPPENRRDNEMKPHGDPLGESVEDETL